MSLMLFRLAVYRRLFENCRSCISRMRSVHHLSPGRVTGKANLHSAQVPGSTVKLEAASKLVGSILRGHKGQLSKSPVHRQGVNSALHETTGATSSNAVRYFLIWNTTKLAV